MKLLLHAIRVNPNAIEEIQMDDVAHLVLNDNGFVVTFNDGKQEVLPLRANDGKNVHEWSGFSIFGTRVGLNVDMSK